VINIAARDLFLNALAFCLLVLIIIIPWINPVPVAADTKPVGQMIVRISWPDGNDDIDLWLKGPDDAVAVGYSRKDGNGAWALLRDDIGPPLITGNEELGIARSLPNGLWAVNLHAYRTNGPVQVKVEIMLFPANGPKVELFNRPVEMFRVGQERTVIQWRMRDGKLVPFSMNQTFVPLRSAGK